MLYPEPGVSGPVREVLLTPETEGDDLGRGGGRRRKMRRRIRKRVEHRMERREKQEQPEECDDGAVEGEDFGRRRGRGVRSPGCSVAAPPWSTIRVRHKPYTVPSRLIGERVRVYDERLEVWYARYDSVGRARPL